MSTNINWGLSPGDGLRQAKSSVVVRPGDQLEIVAFGLCCGDEIKVFKVYRPADCSDADLVAVPVTVVCDSCNCGDGSSTKQSAIITEKNPRAIITEPGEYIVARSVKKGKGGAEDYDVLSQQVEVRVYKTSLKPGFSYGMKGFCNA